MQSRRVWLPEIVGAGAGDRGVAAVSPPPSRDGRPPTEADTTIAVGPEGGWSSKELEVAASTVSLGPQRAARRDRRRRRRRPDDEPPSMIAVARFAMQATTDCELTKPADANAARGVRARAVLPIAMRLLRVRHVDGPPRADRASTSPPCAVDIGRTFHAERRGVDTVFVGGGTPSLVPADAARRRPRARSRSLRGAEVTVECNPTTSPTSCWPTYAAGGVTRISLGVQSMVPRILDLLGRRHDPDNVICGRRVDPARRVRFVQPRPDLRHRQRDARRVAHDVGARPRARPAARLGLRPHRRAGHTARRRPGPLSRRRRAGGGVRARRRPAQRRRARQLRGLQLGRGRATSAGTTCCTGASTTTSASAARRTRTSPAGAGGTCARPSATSRPSSAGQPTEAAGETLDADTRRLEGLQLSLRTTAGVPKDALDGDALDDARRATRRPVGADPPRPPARQRGGGPPALNSW